MSSSNNLQLGSQSKSGENLIIQVLSKDLRIIKIGSSKQGSIVVIVVL